MRCTVGLLVLCACGRIGFDPFGSSTDANDAATADATPGPIHVIVLTGVDSPSPGIPILDVPVLFEASDGTVTELQTDGTGTASLVVSEPTNVHVAELNPLSSPAQWTISTILAVDIGSTIVVGSDAITETSVNVTVPTFGGATSYGAVAAGRCQLEDQGPSTSFADAYSTACVGQMVDVYARAADTTLLAWQVSHTTLTANGSIAFASWQAPVMRTVQYTGIPADLDTVGTDYTADSAGGVVDLEYQTENVPLAGGVATTPIATIGATPTVVGSLFTSTAHVLYVADAFPLPDGTFDPSHLPAEVNVVGPDPTTHVLSWSFSGTGALPASLELAAVQFVQPDSTMVQWKIYAPPSSRAVQYPTVPADLAAIAPTAASIWETGEVFAFTIPGQDYASELAVPLDDELSGTFDIPAGGWVSIATGA